MNVAIVKYNAGNIFSVANALRRIGVEPIITDHFETLQSADRVLLPGQGSADTTMQALCASGLDKLIVDLKQPVLGICVGQQLLCAGSDEGNTTCLNVFKDIQVKKFTPNCHADKVPHMGWNTLHDMSSPLFDGIVESSFVYYVHSYFAPVNQYTIATTDYIVPFSAAMRHNNFFATQFHPEKSGDVGELLLRNFINLKCS